MWNEGESQAFLGNPPRIYPVLNANYRRPIVRFDDVLEGAPRQCQEALEAAEAPEGRVKASGVSFGF